MTVRAIHPSAILALLLLLAASAVKSEGVERRSFVNENVGKVSLAAPKSWQPFERHHINFGTTFYRLLPPKPGQFDLEILALAIVESVRFEK